jgi:hypothetical protein
METMFDKSTIFMSPLEQYKYCSSGDIKIVDLSNMVSMDTDRYETPGLVNHHHGYKSVLPLGRVLSGHKSKILLYMFLALIG